MPPSPLSLSSVKSSISTAVTSGKACTTSWAMRSPLRIRYAPSATRSPRYCPVPHNVYASTVDTVDNPVQPPLASIVFIGARMLSTITPISPVNPLSIVPSCTRNFVFAVTPERGLICASKPFGNSTAIPVGTITVSPGSMITSSLAHKSKPLSVGCALVGMVASSDNRLNPTLIDCEENSAFAADSFNNSPATFSQFDILSRLLYVAFIVEVETVFMRQFFDFLVIYLIVRRDCEK